MSTPDTLPNTYRYGTVDPSKLHVITMISNPVRFSSRYKLWEEFNERMRRCGVSLWTAELQLGARPFAITDPTNPRHIQLRGRDELWAKENCLNVLARHLPDDWEYIAWVDADVEFVGWTNPGDWAMEAIDMLQVYQVIQLWQTATDLGPTGEALQTFESFMSRYIAEGAMHPENAYHEWHPGFAWACTREAWEGMGGLFDVGVAGAGDRHMALALVGQAALSYHKDAPKEYIRAIHEWEQRQLPAVRMDVGFMKGHLIHYWHGKKKDRRYWDRWQILNDTNFNPGIDLVPNYQGVYELSRRGVTQEDFAKSVRLRDLLRYYFRSRNEDSVDL